MALETQAHCRVILQVWYTLLLDRELLIDFLLLCCRGMLNAQFRQLEILRESHSNNSGSGLSSSLHSLIALNSFWLKQITYCKYKSGLCVDSDLFKTILILVVPTLLSAGMRTVLTSQSCIILSIRLRVAPQCLRLFFFP